MNALVNFGMWKNSILVIEISYILQNKGLKKIIISHMMKFFPVWPVDDIKSEGKKINKRKRKKNTSKINNLINIVWL